MAEIEEVLKGERGCAAMIEKNIRDAFDRPVTGDGDGGQRHGFTEHRIHGDQTFDAALQENVRIGVQEIFVVVMSDGEKEKTLLPQIAFDAADDHGSVGVSQVTGNDADGISALHAQGARQIIGAVIEFARGSENSFLGVFGNRTRGGRIIQNRRDGAGSEPNMVSDRLQGDDAKLPPVLILAVALHCVVSFRYSTNGSTEWPREIRARLPSSILLRNRGD